LIFGILMACVVQNGGVAYFGLLWGLLFGNWFARMLKSKDLLISMGNKAMGLV